MRVTKLLVPVLVLGIVIAAAASGRTSPQPVSTGQAASAETVADEQTSTTPADPAAGLTCATPEEPIMDAVVDVGTDLPGEPRSPEAALARFSRMTPQTRGLPVQAFRRSKVAEERVVMAFDRGADRRATAVTERIGDSWYVTYLAVCASEAAE